jgi:hypothetical protein
VIPEWVYGVGSAACLFAAAYYQKREVDRKVANFRAVEAERVARENSAPLGNVSRWFE